MQNSNVKNHWSNFWKGGQLTSLPQDFQENYNGQIKKQWNLIYKNLNNKSKILDLCTGNCAIALLASDYAFENNKEFCITAVDAAASNKESILKKFPHQLKNLENISIISSCKVEDISLPPNQFDLITSQYGIEYCQWDKVAQKIYQLLKSDGKFAMITHAKQSEITQFMQREKEDYQFVFQLGVFETIEEFLNGALAYKIFIKELSQKQNALVAKQRQKPSQLFNTFLTLLGNIKQASEIFLINSSDELKHICSQHQCAYLRLQDLLNVTSKISENPDWYKVFIENGLSLLEKKKVIQNHQHYAGDLYVFSK